VGPEVKAEEVSNFLTALDSAQELTPLDKIVMKDKFFRQRVTVDPDWNQAPPEQRFAFAKKYGISPGLAQLGEGEFYAAGLLPKPQGDLGETQAIGGTLRDPHFGLLGGGGGTFKEDMGDPTNALTGLASGGIGLTNKLAQRAAAALANKTGMGWLGNNFALRGANQIANTPFIKSATTENPLQTIMDYQFLGANRLPGALWRGGKSLVNTLSRFGGTATPTAAGPLPQASSVFPLGRAPMAPSPAPVPPPDWLAR
jgi:hypothetical protein